MDNRSSSEKDGRSPREIQCFFVMQFRELGKTLLCPQLVIRKNYNAEAWCHCMKVWSMVVLLLPSGLRLGGLLHGGSFGGNGVDNHHSW